MPGPFSQGVTEQTWNRQLMLSEVQDLASRAGRAVGPSFATDAQIIQSHLTPQITDQWFNLAQPITLAADASRSTIVSFQVPPGCLGILRAFATAVQNGADWGRIRWAITVDGNPIQGFDNVRGPLSDILYPVILVWPLYRNQLLRVVASNLTSTAISNVTAMIRGTYFRAART